MNSLPIDRKTASTGVGGDVNGTVRPPVFRETVESFAVALILAFLFRAFVAEAFVIPTGSMAPTLMGAHKDVRCPECGFDYQSGASSEFDKLGRRTSNVVVATTCPLCRFELPLDLKQNKNHATFSGDRILVSKFAYLWRPPSRWDVIVFKYPIEARQNYIKRLVGLPKEKLQIKHGDIYVKPLEKDIEYTIARKPPNILEAVLQPVHDTSFRPKSLIKAGYPSSFQPFPAVTSDTAGWKVEHSEEGWKAHCDAANSPDRMAWIRYFHQVVDPRVWKAVRTHGSLPAPIAPSTGKLISDFTHYNASLAVDASLVYEYKSESKRGVPAQRSSTFSSKYRSGEIPEATNYSRRTCFENDGHHWVGDLATEYELEVEGKEGTIALDLVECGIHHQCRIDLASGKATLMILRDGEAQLAFEDKDQLVKEATVQTLVRGSGKYRIRFANVDDQLTLWVGGKSLEFQPSSRYVSRKLLEEAERRPHWSPSDPLDAAPAGIGVSGLKVQVSRARVWRDIYYVAVSGQSSAFNDYPGMIDLFKQSTSESERAQYANRVDPTRRLERFMTDEEIRFALDRDTLFSTPSLWERTSIFSERRQVEFTLEEDQYFPMGDNSPESFDARGWNINYVPERLLIGRAILVFWPHYWNRPIPFLPNVQRMGLIR